MRDTCECAKVTAELETVFENLIATRHDKQGDERAIGPSGHDGEAATGERGPSVSHRATHLFSLSYIAVPVFPPIYTHIALSAGVGHNVDIEANGGCCTLHWY